MIPTMPLSLVISVRPSRAMSWIVSSPGVRASSRSRPPDTGTAQIDRATPTRVAVNQISPALRQARP